MIQTASDAKRMRRLPYRRAAWAPAEEVANETEGTGEQEECGLAGNAGRAVSQPLGQRQRKHHKRHQRDRDGQHADIFGQRQQRDEQSGGLEPDPAIAERSGMHGHDRTGNQDGEQENRDADGLAIKEKIRQRDQQHGDAEAAAIARRAGKERCHERTFLVIQPTCPGVRTKGRSVASPLGASTSHQLSLRSRYGRDQRGLLRCCMPLLSSIPMETAGRSEGGFPQKRAVFVQASSQAPFLSLRRGERWLGEAETEWGNHLATAASGDRRKHRLALRQRGRRLRPRVDPHSVELRSTPLPRSTGERKGALANACLDQPHAA